MTSTDLAAQLHRAANPQARTAAIQDAINAVAPHGGGLVSIPPGTWEICMLKLCSGLTLRLERGSVLRCCADLKLYPALATGHNKDRQPFHLLHAKGCQYLTIEGDGVIDGNGYAFWDEPIGVRRARGEDVSEVLARRPFQVAYPDWWIEKAQRVSPLVELDGCSDVVLRDFTIINSPGWTVHPYCCDRVTIRGVKVLNDLFGPNTDGFDINGCRDVFVSDCLLRCGDDAIIIKATTDARQCERITITNCILASHCATIGLGAEVAKGIRDVTVSNCAIERALRGVQIELWEAGLIENVTISNLTGRTVGPLNLERALYVDIQHHKRSDGALGHVRNVLMQNIALTTRGRVVLTAADGSTIDDLTLRDVHLRYEQIEDASVTVPAGRSSQMSNDSPHSRAVNACLVADNLRRLRVHDLHAQWPDPATPQPGFHGAFLRNVHGGVIDCPWLTSNRSELPWLVQHNSQVEVRSPRLP